MDLTVTLNNGVLMPVVGFGLFKVTEAEMATAVEAAVGAGYRLFDTAQVYKNERHFVHAMKAAHSKSSKDLHSVDVRVFPLQAKSQSGPWIWPRSQFFITSKLHPRNQSFDGEFLCHESSR